MDEIAIRQHIEWDRESYHGFIDMGTEMDSDCLSVAKEALTFMVVSLNDNWKIIIAYFLVEGLCGLEKRNLVNQCLEKLHAVGVKVVSLTCDGAGSNLSMMKSLGCSLDVHNLKTHFPHPVTNEPVYAFLDPSHMLKLVRNTFAEKGCLIDGESN